MTVLKLLGAAVLLVLLVLWIVVVVRNRTSGPSGASPASGPSPLSQWARGEGITVIEPAPPTATYPAGLQPSRLEPQQCTRVIGDLQRDGFTAQTWRIQVSKMGGMALNGEAFLLTVPAAPTAPDFAVAHEFRMVESQMTLPHRFAEGPLAQAGSLRFMGPGATPEVIARLEPLAQRIAALERWVVVGPGAVSLLLSLEPATPQELQDHLTLAREVAAQLAPV